MPRRVQDIDLLSKYLGGVIDRANHHARGVDEVALAIAGAIIWRKDPDPLEVMEKDGDMKNVLWVRISGQRYAFSYNHDAGKIEIRQNSTHGAVLESFTNSTSSGQVKSFFATL